MIFTVKQLHGTVKRIIISINYRKTYLPKLLQNL